MTRRRSEPPASFLATWNNTRPSSRYFSGFVHGPLVTVGESGVFFFSPFALFGISRAERALTKRGPQFRASNFYAGRERTTVNRARRNLPRGVHRHPALKIEFLPRVQGTESYPHPIFEEAESCPATVYLRRETRRFQDSTLSIDFLSGAFVRDRQMYMVSRTKETTYEEIYVLV